MEQLSTRTTATITAATAALIVGATGFVAEAALTDISTVPLASSSSVVVKPNLLLTMDTSGSMGWDFMPDNVNPVVPNVSSNDYPYSTSSPDYPYNQGYTCRSNTEGNNNCLPGDPPYYAYQFNFVAYNPSFSYVPGVNYDGTSRGAMGSPWTSVAVDQYTPSKGNIQLAANSATNGQFPEQVYLNSGGAYKRNGELYCPVPSSTCFPGNVPPTENGVTAPSFAYNTPKGPSLTAVSLS